MMPAGRTSSSHRPSRCDRVIEPHRREIGILANSGLFLAEQAAILATLSDRARKKVRVRICIRDPLATDIAHGSAKPGSIDTRASRQDEALERFAPLRGSGAAEIRVHRAVLNNSICRGDDELLVGQYAYGISAGQSPVLHLRLTDSGEIVSTYLESFERVWASSRPS